MGAEWQDQQGLNKLSYMRMRTGMNLLPIGSADCVISWGAGEFLGALRAWGWAASRALDYLETNPAVDGKHVGIEGVSRYGKAALVTMAFDQRFAMVLVGSSGKGGPTLRVHTGVGSIHIERSS